LRIPLDDNRDGPSGGDSRPPASGGGPHISDTAPTPRYPTAATCQAASMRLFLARSAQPVCSS
jgi:hypothetical protein